MRDLLVKLLPALAALAILALAPFWQPLLPQLPSPPGLAVLALASLMGAAAGLFAPFGAAGLGPGVVVVPVVAATAGPAWAGAVAAAAYLLAETARRLLLSPLPDRGPVIAVPEVAAEGGRVGLAALAAGLVWWLRPVPLPVAPGDLLLPGALAAAAYFAAQVLLRFSSVDAAHGPRVGTGPALAPMIPEALAWITGLPLAYLALESWPSTLAVLGGLALLAAEAERSAHRRRRAIQRIQELRRVSAAGQRIVADSSDPAEIARQVLAECRDVVPFSWFQFELLEKDGESRSWCAAEGGRIEEGVPRPAGSPAALPGIHRRSSWKVLVRDLTADGEPIGRLRFWCDPRRLESTTVELLDSLLPQITSSVQRALLEREANFDPLTGLADRRLLESRLERAFAQSRDEGRSMAVVMCDLDRFKRINDRHGHAVGDGALVRVAELLEQCRREGDLCCRYGGEEFAVVLERTDGETAMQVAERVRKAVQSCEYMAGGRRIPLTVSAGVASYPELHVTSGRELLPLADVALYEAKRRGRNRCLLNVGPGRFQTAEGETVSSGGKRAEVKPPTLF